MNDYSNLSLEELKQLLFLNLQLDEEIVEKYLVPRWHLHQEQLFQVFQQSQQIQLNKEITLAFFLIVAEAYTRSQIKRILSTSLEDTDIAQRLRPFHREIQDLLEYTSKEAINFSLPMAKVVAKDFLESVALRFIDHSSQYMNLVGETPFAFRERQLNSVFAPAISKVAEAFLMELPTNRQNKKQGYNNYGWIDYWAFYRNIDFYLELKHSFISYRGRSVTDKTFYRWEKANEQTKDCATYLQVSYDSRGYMALPIQVIPIYEARQEHEDAEGIENEESLIELHDLVHSSLNPKPNWSCLLMPHKDLSNMAFHEYEDRNECYPGVIIVSRVEEMK